MAALAFIAWFILTAVPAAAAGRYAAMAVDANTGQILHAEAADERRYPASLTKMMTLYLVFELLEERKLSLNTRITISPEAASAPPSRLGLKAGSTITVGDAIKALVTKSANDVSTAIAEHIAGDEAMFAQMMTRKAHALGMKATVFRNAHGLPDNEQMTTARDMVMLGMRLYDHFPVHARLFSLKSFHYAGRTHRNHNTMLNNYAGMEGLKTGYIRQSGYNLVASVRRDGRHVIAAVFGGASGSARNARMRIILDRALQRASRKQTRQPTPRLMTQPKSVAAVRRPAVRPVAAQPVARPEIADQAPGNWRATARMAAPVGGHSTVASALLSPGLNASPSPPPSPPLAINSVETIRLKPQANLARAPSTLQAQARRASDLPDAANRMALRGSDHGTPRPGQTSPAPVPGIQIQIGAYADPNEARQRLEQIRQQAAGLLADKPIALPTVTIKGKTLYRARFAGFDGSAATRTCTELRRRRVDCYVAKAE